MDAARVTAIGDGVTVQARAAAEGSAEAGEWRDIAENDVVNHREELLVEADGAKYGFEACRIQKRVAGVWTDGVIVTLDVTEGTSHFRTDRLSVGGDETNSSVAVTTIEKGDLDLRDALSTLKRHARSRFTLEDEATKYRGVENAIEHGNTAELGGFQPDFAGIIVAPRDQFQDAGVTPLRGMKLTRSNGVSYRITSVKTDDISYEIEVASIDT